MRIETGSRFGHYLVLAALGAGGMGRVYLAEDVRLRRRIALKVLPESLAHDKNWLNRFEQEAFAASALNHPNILTIHEFGVEGETHFLASEFIDGETLRARLQRAPLSLQESLDIAVQTVQALSAAHEANIIHRDIKPENVMIRRDGIVKVLDFGLAKLVEPAAFDTEAETKKLGLTQAGTVMATVHYMSPEQARGKPLDARSDIFSFGALLYEMLTRRQPFTGETTSHVIVGILEQEPPQVEELVPAALGRIVKRALAKRPEERYPSAQALLVELKKLQTRLLVDAELELASSADERTGAQIFAQKQMTAAVKTAPATAPRPQTSRVTSLAKPFARRPLMLVMILVVLAAAVAAYRYAVPNAHIESIAVMPFLNESGNADVEYLSDGMTEALIGSLSQLPTLNVKARSSVFRYKDRAVDARTIARDLNVEAILNGRIVQRGDRVTLNLELVDARTENVIWSEQYHRTLAGLVSLQSEIARDVSSRLQTRLSGADELKLTKRHTDNPEAFQLYLKGRYFWNKRTNDGYQQAIQFFRQATDRDPTYALAYVGLADAHAFLRLRGQSGTDAYRTARSIVQRALEIDDTLGEAHTTMAMLTQNSDWDLASAAGRYERAIELSPNYATAHHWYGELLVQMGRIEEGLSHYKRALEIDPLSLVISSDLGLGYHYARQYHRALEQLQKTSEMDPNFFRTYLYRARVYEHAGEYEKAIADQQRGFLLLGEDPQRVARITAALTEALAAAGPRGYWRKRLEIRQQNPELRIEWDCDECDVAAVQTRLGDTDGAFASLEKAYQERLFDVLFLTVTPEFDALRGDARFEELVQRIGLPVVNESRH